jgi:hypothetical protein
VPTWEHEPLAGRGALHLHLDIGVRRIELELIRGRHGGRREQHGQNERNPSHR